jgi:hypothetical protein
MASKQTHDLVLKVGEYTDRTGATKARTKNIGAVYTKDDGTMFLAIDSLVIAMETQYVANKDRSDRVMVSVYPVREKSYGESAAPARSAPASKPAAPAADDPNDDIPF